MVPTRALILGPADTVIGFIYATGSRDRSSSRAYAVIKQWAPVQTWGVVLTLVGLTLLATLLLRPYLVPARQQLAASIAAMLGAMWCTAWAVPLLLVAHDDKHVSYAGGVLWLLLGAAPHLFLAFGKEG